MNRLNLLFTLSSLSVLLVIVERLSFTTKILLNPYNFLRLHEFIQMTLLILITVILPLLLLDFITSRFKNLSKKEFILLIVFIVGIYFLATGNGVHELASFLFNNYCNTKNFSGNLCNGFFFNNYYFGNILYFIGGFLMIFATLLLEKGRPNQNYKKSDLKFLIPNALIYAFAIFAYAAFDRVLVGLVYSGLTLIFCLLVFLSIRKNYLKFPVITYTTLTYLLGTITALIFRVLH